MLPRVEVDRPQEFEEGAGARFDVSNSFAVPTANSDPTAITLGPDGNLWFAEQIGDTVGRLTTAGEVREFPIPTSSSYPANGIAAGPDGNLWFTEYYGNKIGRISP